MRYLAILFAAAAFLFCRDAKAEIFPCDAPRPCSSLWVAAHNVGVAASFFRKAGQAVPAKSIRPDDEIVAATDVHVYSGPAAWATQLSDPLLSGERARVTEIRLEPTPGGGSQVWLRIADAPAQTPSFRCGDDNQAVARLICADKELRSLDATMARLYFALLGDVPVNAVDHTTADHQRWRSSREGCVEDVDFNALTQAFSARDCLVESYKRRTAQLEQLRKETPDRGGFLRQRPDNPVPNENRFTVVKQGIASARAAQVRLTRLAQQFPGLQFALLEPRIEFPYWVLALSAYTDAATSQRIKTIAENSGVADELIITAISNSPAGYDPQASVVPYCYRSGAQTIRSMYACAGVLITSPVLNACLKGGGCDTGLKPFGFEAYAGKFGWSWDTILQVEAPPDYLAECPQANAQSQRECIQGKAVPPPPANVAGCSGLSLDLDAYGRCLVNALPESIRPLAQCYLNYASGNSAACVNLVLPQPQAASTTCINFSTGDEVSPQTVGCFLRMIPNKYAEALGCILEANFSPNQSLDCARAVDELRNPVAILRCLRTAGANLLRQCAPILPGLGTVGSCLQANAQNPLNCVPPADVTGLAACLQSHPQSPQSCVPANDPAAIAICLQLHPQNPQSCIPPGDASGLAACLQTHPQNPLSCAPASGFAACLLNNQQSPQNCIPPGETAALKCLRVYYGRLDAFVSCYGKTMAELAIVYCIANSDKLTSLISACLPSSIPESVRRIVACAVTQTERAKLASCAAAAFLNNDEQRILACAVGAEGSYFQFAMCALGVNMSKEWMIVGKCAEQSGGNPYRFAGCTAGLLTQRELNLCSKGIGSADGCFGPNNTVVKTIRNMANDIINGPSDSNTAVQLWKQGTAGAGKALDDGYRWLIDPCRIMC